MKIKIPSNVILADETLKGYRDSLYLQGIYPITNESNDGMTVFEISQMNQGALPLMVSIPNAEILGYNFYCEIDKTLLDGLISADFPNSVESRSEEGQVEYFTLREYLFGGILEKGTKALIKIDYGGLNKPSNDNLTDSFLRLFLAEYGNPTMDNVFTSKVAIENKRNEYNQITEAKLNAMLKDELINHIETNNLGLDVSGLKADILTRLLNYYNY